MCFAGRGLCCLLGLALGYLAVAVLVAAVLAVAAFAAAGMGHGQRGLFLSVLTAWVIECFAAARMESCFEVFGWAEVM